MINTPDGSRKKVTKAIIPIAGMGTRLYPQTKSTPKEMLPIINKPVAQYVVEEAIAAGVTEIIFVVGEYEKIVRDYFERNLLLEEKLLKSGRQDMANKLTSVSNLAKFTYVKDAGPYGNALPILNAAEHLGDDPFLLFWADDIFVSEVPRAQQLVDKYNQYGLPVISLIPVDLDQTHKYGVPSIAKAMDSTTFLLDGLVEKPGRDRAPSSYASVGGYLLTPDIIPIIEDLVEYHSVSGGEIYLAEAINKLSKQTDVLGTIIDGRWHDTGNKEGYFKAVVDIGMRDPELIDIVRNTLRQHDVL